MLIERGREGQIVNRERKESEIWRGRRCSMLIERGREGQIVSREVRKQWREGEGVACS